MSALTQKAFRTPARALIGLYAAILLVGTAALALPISTTNVHAAPLNLALFTATSAVSVTGLTAVDTASYWSGFGQVVILALIQLGGLGIVTLGSLAGLIAARKLSLRSRRLAQTESGLDLGDVRTVLIGVLKLAGFVELTLFGALSLIFWLQYDFSALNSLRLGGFHAVSAFNNAGFSLFEDSLTAYVTDPLISIVLSAGVITGAVGYPVLQDIRRKPNTPKRWSLHSKLTLTVMGIILAGFALMFLAFEWSNPNTLGPLNNVGKVVAATFNTSMRTAGFSSVDFGSLNETTQLATMISMFIGGGSVSAAGGVKVTTIALLFMAVWAEYRGDDDITAFRRRIPQGAVRQALAVSLTGVMTLLIGTMLLLATSDLHFRDALFEATSATSIVGLSTGITAELNHAGRVVVSALMLIGRLGPMTVGTALVLRERERLYRFAQERPIVG